MNKLISLLTIFVTLMQVSQPALAALSNSERAVLDRTYNRLTNPGFEASYAGWATSAVTPVVVSAAANIGSGDRSISWDSASAAQTFSSGYTTITSGDGLSGNPMVASCRFKCATGTCTHTIEAYDGTNKLGSTTITSSTTSYIRTNSSIFSAPASGTIRLQVSSVASNEPNLYIDDCYLGLAEGWNLVNITQAQVVGTAHIPQTASCSFDRNNSTIGDFSSDADCPIWAVDNNPGPGTLGTANSNLPQITGTGLQSGLYNAQFDFTANTAGSNVQVYFDVSDGTTTSGQITTSPGVARNGVHVSAWFPYTTAPGSKPFKLRGGAGSADTVKIALGDTGEAVNFSLTRYPLTPETAILMNTLPASWSGYWTAGGATWTRLATTYAAPTNSGTAVLTELTNRNFGTVTTGASNAASIVLTPARSGRLLILASVPTQDDTNGTVYGVKMMNDSTMIGEGQGRSATAGYTLTLPVYGITDVVGGTSTTISLQSASFSSGTVTIGAGSSTAVASVVWSIVALDQSFPAPYLQPLNRTECYHIGGNGYGSTDTKIPKYTTNLCTGSDITPGTYATDGTKWTVAPGGAGLYCMYASVDPNSASANTTGFSKNATSTGETTVTVMSVTPANLLSFTTNNNGTVTSKTHVSACEYGAVGDVFRPHTDGYTNDGTKSTVRIIKMNN